MQKQIQLLTDRINILTSNGNSRLSNETELGQLQDNFQNQFDNQ